MTALGELLIFIIYLFFGTLLLVRIYKEFKSKTKLKTDSIKRIIFSALPLILWASWMYYVHRTNELDCVGKYILTEYPNCDSCILELKSDNFYQVTSNEIVIEKGEWNYDSGGDYWIVEIGKHGQLGSGKFKYSDELE